MRILRSFRCSRWRRAAGSSRLSPRSDAMWEFSPALGFFRLRRRERCGVMMPEGSPAALRDEKSSLSPFFCAARSGWCRFGAGVMEAGAMQQEPSPALPPRSLRRHPRGSACFRRLFLRLFPAPGFSWHPRAAAGGCAPGTSARGTEPQLAKGPPAPRGWHSRSLGSGAGTQNFPSRGSQAGAGILRLAEPLPGPFAAARVGAALYPLLGPSRPRGLEPSSRRGSSRG